jgi:hypothetical protein
VKPRILILISLLLWIICEAIGEGLYDRGKSDKAVYFSIKNFRINLFVELSKLVQGVGILAVINIIGWNLFWFYILARYVVFNFFFNLARGNKPFYRGDGWFDRLTLILTFGNVWVYLVSIIFASFIIWSKYL